MLPDQVSPMKKSINELVNAMRYVELKNRGIYLRKKLIMRVYEMLEKDDVYGLPVLPSDDYVCSMESLRRFNHYRMMPVDSIWTEKARFAGEDERLHSMAEHIIQKHKETCSRTERNLNRRMKKISHLLLSLKQEGKTPDLEIEGLLREIEINDANLEDMVDVFEDISTIDYDKNNSIGLDNPTEPPYGSGSSYYKVIWLNTNDNLDYKTSNACTTPWNEPNPRYIIMHEFGHWAGLNHHSSWPFNDTHTAMKGGCNPGQYDLRTEDKNDINDYYS